MYAGSLARFLVHQHAVYLFTGMQGNIGDHLIWAGTEHVLAAHGVPATPIGLEAVHGEHRPGCLVIPGSGAFSALFNEWLPDLVVRLAPLFDHVLIAPSAFDPEVPCVHRAMSCPNVIGLARDADSYRRISAFGRANLGLDLALHQPSFDPSLTPKTSPRSGTTLVAMRTDAGSLLGRKGLAVHPDVNRDIALDAVDLTGYVDAVRAADSVITDRLHVVATAVMTGTRVQYVDPYDRKISAYVAFTFRSEADHLLEEVSYEWLLRHGHVVTAATR
jgi:hypothetical protein